MLRRSANLLESVDTSTHNSADNPSLPEVSEALRHIKQFYLMVYGLPETANLPASFFGDGLTDHATYIAVFNWLHRSDLITPHEAIEIVYPEVKLIKGKIAKQREKGAEVDDSQLSAKIAQLNSLRDRPIATLTRCPDGRYLKPEVEQYAIFYRNRKKED